MKTQKILFSCLIFLSMVFKGAVANETESLVSARSELLSNIDKVLNNVPFEEYIGNTDVCAMTITFRVNEDATLGDFEVRSNNESMNEITERILIRSKLTTDPSLEGIKFRVQVSYINEAYHH